MSKKTYDINQAILVVIRRGRGGRGYSVAPVDSPTDVAACADADQVGDAIVEMLDDENQPRVDIDELMRAAEGDEEERAAPPSGKGAGADLESSDSEDDEEEDEDEEDEEEEEDAPWHRADDPAEALLLTGLSKLLEKGRKLSKRTRHRRSRTRKAKKA